MTQARICLKKLLNSTEVGCKQFTARRHIVSAICMVDIPVVVVMRWWWYSEQDTWPTANVPQSGRSACDDTGRDGRPSGRCTLDRITGVKLLPGGQLGFALASRSVGSCCCYYCVGRLLNVLTNTRHRQFPVVIVSSHEIVVTASHPKVLGRTCSPALHS